ncbi:MAG: hypothetical protein FJZ07_00565 [Candidatus Nealsonbacteria bacterium]|nr:hypothetical protein [Candidatus Nealsonbacteria bacterium]
MKLLTVICLLFVAPSSLLAQVMRSDNYRLEFEAGEINPVEGLRERGLKEVGQDFLKDLKAEFLSAGEFTSGKIIFFLVILIPLVFVSVVIIKRKKRSILNKRERQDKFNS